MKAPSASRSRLPIRGLVAGAALAGLVACGASARAESGKQGAGAEPPPPARIRLMRMDRTLLEKDQALFRTAAKYFPGDERKLPAKRLFRLTRDQLDASVASLLPGYKIASVKATMARDPLQTNYEYAELLSFNNANLGALQGWIRSIAAEVKARPEGVVDCTASRNASDCLEARARAFVIKAFRGDVDETKVDRLAHFYVGGVRAAGFAAATAELVEVVLSSPDFLFRKELDVMTPGASAALKKVSTKPEPASGGLLAPAQLLQTLTYTIADVPPEQLALSSADAGQHLRTGPEARATIQAIVKSPAAREKLVRFFKAWLEIREPGEFAISREVFKEFTPELAKAMAEETDRFLRAELAKPSPRLKDITQATQSYISRALDPIYGTQVKDGSGTRPTDLDTTKRLGIFSQPAVIASHSGPTDTRLVKRGVFWTRKLMCMEMAPPPKGLDVSIYEAKTTTERKRIEDATAKPACIGCHQSIDPFGFFQENYDALGRWRLKEENGHEIDASVLIDFLGEEPRQANGPVEALEILTGSDMFKQCFVRQMFRFYMGRQEDAADEPLLRRMFFEFAHQDRQDILRALEMLAASERIAMRQ